VSAFLEAKIEYCEINFELPYSKTLESALPLELDEFLYFMSSLKIVSKIEIKNEVDAVKWLYNQRHYQHLFLMNLLSDSFHTDSFHL